VDGSARAAFGASWRRKLRDALLRCCDALLSLDAAIRRKNASLRRIRNVQKGTKDAFARIIPTLAVEISDRRFSRSHATARTSADH